MNIVWSELVINGVMKLPSSCCIYFGRRSFAGDFTGEDKNDFFREIGEEKTESSCWII
jgi:hypothetical protein